MRKKIAVIIFLFLFSFSPLFLFSQKAHADLTSDAIAAALGCIADPSSCSGNSGNNQPAPTEAVAVVVPTAAPAPTSAPGGSGANPPPAPPQAGPTFIPGEQYVANNHDGRFVVVIKGETKYFPTQKEAENYYNSQFPSTSAGPQNPGSGTPPLYVTGPNGFVNPSAYPGQKTKNICELGEQPSGNCNKTICVDGTLVDGGAQVCDNGHAFCKEAIEGACKLHSTCAPNTPIQTTSVSECKTGDGKKGTSGGHCYCQADGQSVVCASETACTPSSGQSGPTPTSATNRTIPTTAAKPTCTLSQSGAGITNLECAGGGGTTAPTATPTPRR